MASMTDDKYKEENNTEPPVSAAEEGRLLQRGARVDVANKAMWTPLMLAAKRGHRHEVSRKERC
ncbi:Ankyrin repeat-containing domain [Phytophthora cactorum]|nr:Ankyrin repeat-containing domain [Phytophthora cactorum]